MNRILDLTAFVTLLLAVVSAASAFGQATIRTIPFDRNMSITERLLPGDVNVVVSRGNPSRPPGPPDHRESLELEIRRLSGYSTVAILEIADSQTEFADGDTWIRTRLRGHVTQVIKAGPLADQGGQAEFWEEGGRKQVGAVTVTAGIFPEFIVGDRYLVFLRADQGSTYAARAFRVSGIGIVEAMKRNDGSLIIPWSNLNGRDISEVTRALLQAR